MDIWPYSLLRQVVSLIPNNADRIKITLLCKRLFEVREKYLSFNTQQFILQRTKYNSTSIASHLNSYKQIIFNDVALKKNQSALITIPMHIVPLDSFDHCFFLSMTSVQDIWQDEILSMHDRIGRIEIMSPSDYPFSSYFWIELSVLMEKLSRSGSNVQLAYNERSWNRRNMAPLPRLPFTELTIVFDGDVASTDHTAFNQTIMDLPISLTVLNIKGNFVGTLDGVLPDGLKVLTMDDVWNQPITPGIIPSGLESLSLGRQYNHHLDLECIHNLTHLSLGAEYNHVITSPPSLKKLIIRSPNPVFSQINESLKTLILKRVQSNVIATITGSSFPSLTCLQVRSFTDKADKIHLMSLPLSIQSLSLQFSRPFTLPTGLRELSLCTLPGFGSKKNKHWLSDSITSLTINQCDEIQQIGDIPSSVTSLTYHSGAPINFKHLPTSLRSLTISGELLRLHRPPSNSITELNILDINGRMLARLHRLTDTLFLLLNDDLSHCGFTIYDSIINHTKGPADPTSTEPSKCSVS
ncbi:hypothetical protein SAMD00019534_007120 [Acytostelium subglobosum LB1]|uniref:hypothetical protein n=1 Tax=Acytostelium subglobosum LB1 TaxID=1410327 RepID=UPI0006448AAF|nr:hypothetical protein SAMD00019534_007120 [Acytostelium subglobosum LB1]GAM17537.1 hypothetical protein SAMD00019534_007120 [Acytostelium subglobosum LB1]|eukprot:XP_012759599.1 hypothetical protein SAMD00019534_007120 [Acytostelium subglobosum LB1]